MNSSILNALSLPAFMVDTRHVVVAWNGPCELLTGIAAADVLGTNDHWKGFYDEPRPCLADLVLDNLLADASRFYSLHEIPCAVTIESSGRFGSSGSIGTVAPWRGWCGYLASSVRWPS